MKVLQGILASSFHRIDVRIFLSALSRSQKVAGGDKSNSAAQHQASEECLLGPPANKTNAFLAVISAITGLKRKTCPCHSYVIIQEQKYLGRKRLLTFIAMKSQMNLNVSNRRLFFFSHSFFFLVSLLGSLTTQ